MTGAIRVLVPEVSLCRRARTGNRLAYGQAGFSLVELVVAMTVGLLILAAVGTLVVNSSRAHRELNEISRQVENGRYVMQLLNDEIHHAGFYGEYFDLPAPPAALPDPCITVPAALPAAMPLPIQGYDAPLTSPISCLAAANHVAGTDILVLRRASTGIASPVSLTAGEVYLQTTNMAFVLDTGPEDAISPKFILTKMDGALSDVRKYRVDIYYISPCNVPAVAGGNCDAGADGGNPVPTLKRLVLTSNSGGGTTLNPEPVAIGIENIQIDYGIDNDSDGIPDVYTTDPGTTANWANVVALQAHLLARTIERIHGYTDGKTYAMGGAGNVTPGGAGVKRHVFTSTMRAINPASRREMP